MRLMRKLGAKCRWYEHPGIGRVEIKRKQVKER